MSAPAAEVEAPQPAPVADAASAQAVEEQTKDGQTKDGEPAAEAGEQANAGSSAAGKTEGIEKSEAEPGEQVAKDDPVAKPAPLLKTKAQLNKDKSNKKYDASVLPVTDDPQTIRTQIEFYFGDSNLPTDKHMWTITGGTENKPVKLKHILSFKRCQRFQPYSAVVAALRDSKKLEISGPEGDEEIKRKHPYTSASGDAQSRTAASVYVKGFGDETPTTQFDIEAFFARYGPVNAIRLRRTEEDYFKGSVFVEFPTEEAAKSFLELDPRPTYQGHELKIMSKRAYIDEKNQLIKEGKLEPSQSYHKKKFWEGKELGGSGRGGRSRNGDSDDWRKRRENDQKNGFRDGNRGSRFRGRGGRGRGGRHDRNGRDWPRDGRRDEAAPPSTNNVQKPKVNSSAKPEEARQEPSASNSKRAREDDGATEPPAKKVVTKVETDNTAERTD